MPEVVDEHDALRELVEASVVPLRVGHELLDKLGGQLAVVVVEERLGRKVTQHDLEHTLGHVTIARVRVPLDRIAHDIHLIKKSSNRNKRK